MRRLFLGGVLVELALLIIGLTWIAPLSGGSAAGSGTPAAHRAEQPNGNVVDVELVAEETTQEVAPGVKYHVWTFNGTVPGPVIRVHVGDTVRFTLTNNSSIGMQHSIDFHAAVTPWDANYQPVDPGKTVTFDWVAKYPGVFMYHCGVPPVLQHISNGMYGAIVVEPSDLPQAREYVLVSSELYPGPRPVRGAYEGDYERMLAARPRYVVFNGAADQYLDAPLLARPNELIRLWVMNAGPTLTTAFHVIGGIFERVYADGNPANVLHGVQTYNVPPGGGAMFELRIPDAGLYPFVTHSFAYTGLGAVGVIKVDPSAGRALDSYPQYGDPFSGGVKPAAPGTGPDASPGGTTSPGPAAGGGVAGSCEPSAVELEVVAKDVAFDSDCLASPASKAFTIAFDNRDPGVPHNVAIYTDSTASTPLFVGDTFSGPDVVTYAVHALDGGTYFFRCDVHPAQMTGTFVVK